MDLSFDGRVAIITGAGGAIGRSHALELARRGARVVVNDVGGSVHGEGEAKTAAQLVVDEIKAGGGEAVANFDTVTTPEGGEAIVQCALSAFGRVDILVNNAGILRDRAFHNMTIDDMNAVLDVHLRGAMFVTQPAFRLMREQKFGRIVNTTSASGLFGNFGQANYGAAKAGLWGLTRVLAHEGSRVNIRVNAIAPLARTRMTEGLFGELEDLLAPASITAVVAYLAHESCELNGCVYSVAGGRVARIFMAETQGVLLPSPTAEAFRDSLQAVDDGAGKDGRYFVPSSLSEEKEIIERSLRTLKAVEA
ncbi:MAG TPA: SDR family oxidoreductase [Acidimicrobiales bacterium]|nr:SDR family oxidoreductase [Acidimicrobiales bacterium]